MRKLRYIAELDSKSAALQQQMSEMAAELRTLQENTMRLGKIHTLLRAPRNTVYADIHSKA